MTYSRKQVQSQRGRGAEMRAWAAANCKLQNANCKMQIDAVRFLSTSWRFCGSFFLSVAVLFSSYSSAADVDDAVLKSETDRIAAAAKAIPSVLAIFADGGQGGGSGVVITPDGYALSNFHVTKPCGDYMQCGMADGRLYDAVIVGVDPVGDVALIKLFGRDDFPAAELGDSDTVQVGDWCFAMGNPFLLATDFTPSVSYGVVSGVHRYQYPAGTLLEYADCIQTDAAINPGNSGGPLFDAQGRLIGINGRGSFEKRGRVNVGVGYAISINQIKNFLGALRSGRIVDHATLGAQLTTADTGDVVVTNILEDCDAFRRGLRVDDEVVRFAGRSIRSVNAFKNVLGTLPRDWRVPLTFRRDGQTHEIYVRLMGVHREDELIAKTGGMPEPPQPRPREPMPDGRRPEGQQPDGKQPDGEPGAPPDGNQPDEDGDGPRKDGKGRRPPFRLPRAAPKKVNMPEIVKQHFEKGDRGFANYFFNRQNQERLWKGLVDRGNFAEFDGPWMIAGMVTGNVGECKITLASLGARIELPTGDSEMTLTEGWDMRLNPPGSGGMLGTLWLWRKLLVEGPKRFGKLEYRGTAPLPERGGLFDVLVGTAEGVDCLFYFDQSGGMLVALEMYPAGNDADPCEIYFLEYQEYEGRHFPRRMEVRHGDRVFGVFELATVELQKSGEK
jgi:serine protease Do